MNTKKILLLLLTLVLAFSLCFTLVSCDDGQNGDDAGENNGNNNNGNAGTPENQTGLKFAVKGDGSYKVVGYVREGNATSVVIPETYEKFAVTEISANAFENCDYLTSVTISGKVKVIGEYAFNGCTELTSINIPVSVTDIGKYAFRGCSKLAELSFAAAQESKNTLTIGNYAFSECVLLAGVVDAESELDPKPTVLTLPERLVEIGEYAFNGCTSLAAVSVPSTVTDIKHGAFFGCSALASITFADKCALESISPMTFMGCEKLASIAIPSKVTYISYNAFKGCDLLSVISIPASLNRVGSGAFDGANITTINITDLDAWSNIQFSNYCANPYTAGTKLYKDGVEIPRS